VIPAGGPRPRGGDGERRWDLDFGRRGKLYSARGTRFKDRAMTEDFLASIRVRMAEGLDAARQSLGRIRPRNPLGIQRNLAGRTGLEPAEPVGKSPES